MNKGTFKRSQDRKAWRRAKAAERAEHHAKLTLREKLALIEKRRGSSEKELARLARGLQGVGA